jgi:hypothetical protein
MSLSGNHRCLQKINWTSEKIHFLRENYTSMTNQELANAIGERLTSTRTKLYELGFKRMEMEYWTKDQVDFLFAYYPIMGDVEIAEIFNEIYPKKKVWTKNHIDKKRSYLQLIRTKYELAAIRIRNNGQSRYSINHWKRWHNRARKQGETVLWTDQNGRETVMIKWSGGRFFGIYDTLAHITWFLNYGPIEKGMKIIHMDGNTLNCNIENLAKYTAAECAKFNAEQLNDNYILGRITWGVRKLRKFIPPELIEAKRAQLLLNRSIINHGCKTETQKSA